MTIPIARVAFEMVMQNVETIGQLNDLYVLCKLGKGQLYLFWMKKALSLNAIYISDPPLDQVGFVWEALNDYTNSLQSFTKCDDCYFEVCQRRWFLFSNGGVKGNEEYRRISKAREKNKFTICSKHNQIKNLKIIMRHAWTDIRSPFSDDDALC